MDTKTQPASCAELLQLADKELETARQAIEYARTTEEARYAFEALDKAADFVKSTLCRINDASDPFRPVERPKESTANIYLHINDCRPIPGGLYISENTKNPPCLHIGYTLGVFMDVEQIVELRGVCDEFLKKPAKVVRDAAG